MRKLSLLITALLLSMLTPALRAETITEDFESWTGFPVITGTLANGWGYINNSQRVGMAVVQNGVNSSKCVKFQYAAEGEPAIITEAKAGMVSIQIRCSNMGDDKDPGGFFAFYKMEKSAKGSYSFGEEIVRYAPLENLPGLKSPTEWITVSLYLPEDTLLGIAGCYCMVDNYENQVGVGTVPAEETIKEDFNHIGEGCGDFLLDVNGLPAGWYGYGACTTSLYEMSWYEWRGAEGWGCLCFNRNLITPAKPETMSYLVTYAHAGKIAFYVKPTAQAYLNSENGWLGLNKMTGEPGSFALGEEIVFYDRLKDVPGEPELNADGYSRVEFDIAEDGWIGITGGQIYFDNYSNTYLSRLTYTVSGTVTDTHGTPLAGVKIELSGCEPTVTGEDGSFLLENAVGKNLVFTAVANGYVKYMENVDVETDKTLNVTLQPTISTMVLTASDYNASITTPVFTLYDGETPICEDVTAGEDGKYVFTVEGVLNPLGYRLVGYAKYFESYDNPVLTNDPYTSYPKIIYGQTSTSTAYLKARSLSLTVTVMNTDREYVTDAQMSLAYPDGAALAYTRIPDNNGDGTYTFTAINAAEAADMPCILTCSVPGMKEIEPMEIVFDDENRAVEVIAIPYDPTIITGRVIDTAGEPVHEATVRLFEGTEITGTPEIAEVSPDGYFSFTLEKFDCAYTLVAAAENYKAVEPVVFEEIVRETTYTHNFVLEPIMYTFTATVRSEQGTPVADATVTLSDNEGNEYGLDNKGDGSYVYSAREDKMSFGTHVITVTREGFQPYADEVSFTPGSYIVTKDVLLLPNGIAALFTGQSGAVNANGKIYVNGDVRIFSIEGLEIRAVSTREPVELELEPGIYIVEGRKMIVK